MLEFIDRLDRMERRLAKALPDLPKQKQVPSPDLVAARSDFEVFCRLTRIVTKSGRREPLIFNPIQSIFNIERTGRDVVLKPRQIGFSTLELARDLWTFLCKEGARVVVVCQSVADGSPAKLISGVLRIMIEGLRESGWPIEFQTEAWNEWTLSNGNSLRIVVAGASEASASKKGRAGTITRLHLTETAFYEYAEATLNALLECVPGIETGSEIVSESTPNGATGKFYQQCKAAQEGKSAYKFHFYAWYHHPDYRVELGPDDPVEPQDEAEERLAALGVTPEQLKWRRQKIADKNLDDFNQEYPEDPETCFLISGRSYFDASQTEAMIKAAAGREPLETRLQGRVRIWKRPVSKRAYVLALDPSEGIGGDPAGGILLDWESGEHVATIDGQLTPAQLAEVAAELAREYNNALLAPERNNHGHAVLLALLKADPETQEPLYGNIYEHDDERLGHLTNQVTRPQILSDLEDSHRKGLLKTSDTGVLGQFRTFVIRNGKPQAATGSHDDLVLAYAIAWAIRQRAVGSGWEDLDDDTLTGSLTTFGAAGGRGF